MSKGDQTGRVHGFQLWANLPSSPTLDLLPLELPHSGIDIEAIEKELILRALRKFDWNQTHAARFLNLSRKTLMYRMEKFELRKEQQERSQPGATPQR